MKERILMDVARNEFEFIKGAIEHKTKILLNYLDECKAEADKENGGAFSAIYQPSVFSQMLRKMVDEEYEKKTTQVILNETQINAMKRSGIWDDPVKRENYLKKLSEIQTRKRRGRPPVKKTATRKKNVK